MIARYHLDFAVLAAVVGVIVLVATVRIPVVERRGVALANLVGALLASLRTDRALPWIVVSLVVLAVPDDPERPHPLGRFTPVLAVVALAGIWTGVPDTEAPIAAALSLAPLAAWYLVGRRSPGPAGTMAVVVSLAGTVWTGSAGWGAAMATVGAVGLIATAPLVFGFCEVRGPRRLGVLVAVQFAVGLLLPRFVAFRSVPVAAGTSVAVNVALVLAALVILRTPTFGPHEPGSV